MDIQLGTVLLIYLTSRIFGLIVDLINQEYTELPRISLVYVESHK